MINKIISLEGVEVIAPIGYYEQERINKNTFIIDISVEIEVADNSIDDEIRNTLDYERLSDIISCEMEKECKLMEDAAQRILNGMISIDSTASRILIVILKLNPPLAAMVANSKITLDWKRNSSGL